MFSAARSETFRTRLRTFRPCWNDRLFYPAGFSPAVPSTDHGSWEQTGRQKFSAVHIAFLFNRAGVLAGTQKITEVIEIKGDKCLAVRQLASSLILLGISR